MYCRSIHEVFIEVLTAGVFYGKRSAIRVRINVAVLLQADQGTGMLENYLDVAAAAEILKVHPETIKRLIRRKVLPAEKVGNKWVIERDRLQGFAGAYDSRRGRDSRAPTRRCNWAMTTCCSAISASRFSRLAAFRPRSLSG